MSDGPSKEGFQRGTCYLPGTIRQLAQDIEDDFLIEGLVATSSLIIVGGESKQGKSILCTNMALAIARGEPWLGRQVKQGPVVWCCYEESLGERAFALAAYDGIAETPFYTLWPPEEKFIDDPFDGILWFERVIETVQPVLLVIDTLVEGWTLMKSVRDEESSSRSGLCAW